VKLMRPVLAPVVVALSSVVLLTGCGAGFNAQTIQPYSATDGAIGNSGDIRVLNALVVAAPDQTRGVISLTIVNRGDRDDRLTGITSNAGDIDLTGRTDLLAGRAVRFGAATNPSATISNLTQSPGMNIRLRLTFTRTEPISLDTVVVPATGVYADVTPGPETPEPSPSPTDSASPSPSES
jgi:hypothetical protein